MAIKENGINSLEAGWQAFKALAAVLQKPPYNRNEAETRFHFIDRFLVECLSWPREEIRVETPQARAYTDYELGTPRAVIWEAKREGIYFELPANPTGKILASIPSVTALSAEAADAIKQAQEYCSLRGVQFAVVCNGHQLIAFLAVRFDGVAPLDGKCLAIDGYEKLDQNFPVIWQHLSRNGVRERRLVRLLVTGMLEGIPRKLSSYLPTYPAYRYKSDSQSSLRTIAELLLEDVVNTPDVEPQFYKECYCESGALTQHALISRRILTARYASLFDPRADSPSLEPVKPNNKEELALTQEVIAEALARRPIVLIGDVGVGKTSFLKHLMYVTAAKEFQQALYIYIDLGSQAALEVDLKAFVTHQIQHQLLERYNIDVYDSHFVKGVYNLDIKRFKSSIYGELYSSDPARYEEKLTELLAAKLDNKPEHLRQCIHHINKGQKKQVILIVDNADQRSLDVQQSAFVIAQNFSQQWESTVFIAVRPQTFHHSKRSGTLSAYPQKAFSISPPRIDVLLEKRLVFALNMAEGRLPVERLYGVKLNLHSIALFLKALLYSLKNNSDLVELLSHITGGNMRIAIELITKFIGSPNVDADKIIDIMEHTGIYQVPVHEFSKSALLGDYTNYNPDSSIAMNIFDIRFPDVRSHFLVSMILSYLNYDASHRNREGFVSLNRMHEEMQNRGFTVQQVEDSLRRATNKRLIETTERVTFDEDVTGLIGDLPSAFRITTVGAYHLLRWAPSFAYLDAMVFDTPIFDDRTMEYLAKNPTSLEINDRYERASAFRSYLTTVWNEASLAPPYFNWNSLLTTGQESFDSVAKVIKKRNPDTAGIHK